MGTNPLAAYLDRSIQPQIYGGEISRNGAITGLKGFDVIVCQCKAFSISPRAHSQLNI